MSAHDDAIECLTPDTYASLYNLHQAPNLVTEAAINLLPLGSRIVLAATGMISVDHDGESYLTDFGAEVIRIIGQENPRNQK